ncbi:MAG: pseudouridine synthase [Candidatus Cloacimonetes bacterium]|nr:rRNA pseudouridine synthase [Candidatus Cloacimonadota bacterium]MDD2210579.1 pseudouridine synthase [Candidatus Cloacimonadota bacterium]MDD3282080.1 pseudouridine synthase [Candidatus Cloacimonadota bacterium]MDD4231757.1 pseudouridine synthase [Candidatus Cloacimonadota bacterium]MDY0298607.1 pseudouridine synthase [Candidatus Cloacimonadaceae bacterium]
MKSSKTSSNQQSKIVLKPGKLMRLNRYLALCGLGSRRKTEEFIRSGQIVVNNQVVKDLACIVDIDADTVVFNGKKLSVQNEKIYIILNKPTGYVVSQQDEYDRKTVYSLLPEQFSSLPYAGRLDKSSEGLLLFTDDGDLIQRLTHPAYKVEKIYRVRVAPKLGKEAILRLREGIEIEGGKTQSAKVYVKSATDAEMLLRIGIKEGRKRQIRHMIEAVGAKVRSLRRVQFGPLILGDLPSGRWRPLLPNEVRSLLNAVKPHAAKSVAKKAFSTGKESK